MASDTLHLCDYAVMFIDLLGQRAEMPGRHLPTDPKEALALVKKSVGRIVGTQNNFQKFYEAYSSGESMYLHLPQEIQKTVPDMAPGELKWQRFSDGLVVYAPLGPGVIKSPVNSIFGMLIAAGYHCLIGLAAKSPVRIGIDAAWGVEYRPGELYGAALAYSYDLESKVAKWPRVVVGDGIVGYLRHYSQSNGSNLSSKHRKEMANICLNLFSVDTDGQTILHYLGNSFSEATRYKLDSEVIGKAIEYIQSQLQHWMENGDNELAHRYKQLSRYFTSHANTTGRNPERR